MYIILGLIIFMGIVITTQFFCSFGLIVGGLVQPMIDREKVFWGIMTLLTMSITVPIEIYFLNCWESINL